jgi:ribosomal protein L11 methyltransferase
MRELVLLVPAERVDSVSDALLFELGALSVSVEDADAGQDTERALFGEPGMPAPASGWARSRLVALYDSEAAARDAADALIAALNEEEHANDIEQRLAFLGIQPVPDNDWVRLTQSQFEPIAITPGFWVVPTWHDAPTQATHVLRLDPGLAFGSGTHPTTRMCLGWLAQAEAHGMALTSASVLDYGCGSGILAIAAAMLGAQPVLAVDIDEAAVQATQDNAKQNGVQLQSGLPNRVTGAHHVVLANILAVPLKILAPVLTRHVAPGGHLVLAGVLERQTTELQQAYAPWIDLQVANTQEGWVLLHGIMSA